MRILTRCSDLVLANIHGFLDRLEKPIVMIEQVVREMEDRLAAARSYAASAIAAERRLGRELAAQRVAVDVWMNKARAAVAANRDDLARLALARKKEHETLATELAEQHRTALETTVQVRASLQALESGLATARRRQRSLIVRHSAALARRELSRANGMPLADWHTTAAKLEHFAERVTELEDEINAQAEVQGLTGVEATFAGWESETELERELNELKGKAT